MQKNEEELNINSSQTIPFGFKSCQKDLQA